MDRKMAGIISLMLAAFTFILTYGSLYRNGQVTNSIDSSDLTYVERFFDEDTVIDIYVTLSESDYEDMMQNPTQEEYKQADVIVDGETMENVGFRVKGNSSLNMVASSDSDRFSFKLDFDQYISEQNLAGLTKLNLNNSVSDPSYMREYLSYWLLGEMGVPTPAYCYANVYVNGELVGLYLAVEGIEEPFLERTYGSSAGALYKPEGQGSDLVYIDDNIESYSGIELVTDSKNGDDTELVAMIKALNEGSDLDSYLDIDEILRYFAVNTVLVNMDSYQGNFKHNYYLYEEDGVFSILPWDFNMSFGGFSMGGTGGELTSLYIDSPLSGTTLAERPLIGKLLEVEEYKELYHRYLEEFINGPFTVENMNKEIEHVANMIRPYLEQDPTKFYSMEQFEQALTEGSATVVGETGPQSTGTMGGQRAGDNKMMDGNAIGLGKFVRERISNVSQQLSGELPAVGDTAAALGMQPGNFADPQQGDRPAGQMPQGEIQLPAKMNRENPPDINMKSPPDINGQNLPKNGIIGAKLQQTSSQTLYMIGGSLLALLVTLIIIFKKKTKYQL